MPAEARLLVSNRRDAPAVAWAAEAGLSAHVVPTLKDPVAADRALADILAAHDIDLLVLSGYLRKLGPVTLDRFAGRILNVHPGPLPEFGGVGMYGSRVHEAVVKSGVSRTAIVIHVVEGEYDQGPELARRWLPIRAGESAASLEARVRAEEPAVFLQVVRSLIAGEMVLPGAEARQVGT